MNIYNFVILFHMLFLWNLVRRNCDFHFSCFVISCSNNPILLYFTKVPITCTWFRKQNSLHHRWIEKYWQGLTNEWAEFVCRGHCCSSTATAWCRNRVWHREVSQMVAKRQHSSQYYLRCVYLNCLPGNKTNNRPLFYFL